MNHSSLRRENGMENRCSSSEYLQALEAAGKVMFALSNNRKESSLVSPPNQSSPSPPLPLPDNNHAKNKDETSAMAKLKDENNALRRQFNELNEKASEWRAKAAKCNESERQLKVEMNKIDEDRVYYTDSLEQLAKTIEETKVENLSLKKTVSELQAKIGVARNPDGTKRSEVSLQTDPHIRFDLSPQLRQLQRELEGLKRNYNELNEENKRLKQANGELLHTKASLEERNAQIVEEGKQAQVDYALLQQEAQNFTVQLEYKERQLVAATAELDQLRQASIKAESVHRAKYEEVKAQREEMRVQVVTIDKKYAAVKKTMADTQVELEETKIKLDNANAGNDALVKSWKELCLLKDRLKTLPSALQSATDAKQEVASLRREMETAFSTTSAYLNAEITKILNSSSTIINSLAQKNIDAQKDLEKAAPAVIDLNRKLSSLQAENAGLSDQLKKATKEVSELNNKCAEAMTFTHVLQEKLENEKKKVEEASNEVCMKEKMLTAVHLAKEDVEEKLKTAESDLQKVRRFQADLQTEVKELRELREQEMKGITLELENTKVARDELRQKVETLEKSPRTNDQQEMKRNASGIEAKCEKYKQDLNASHRKNRQLKERFRKAVSRCNTLDQSNNRFAENQRKLQIDLDSTKREMEKLDVYRRMYSQALKVASTLEQKIREFVPQLDPSVQNAGREFLSRFSAEFSQQLSHAHVQAIGTQTQSHKRTNKDGHSK